MFSLTILTDPRRKSENCLHSKYSSRITLFSHQHLSKYFGTLLLLTSTIFANTSPLPYHITAHSMIYQRQQKITTYYGNVVLHHGPSLLTGNVLKVFFSPNNQSFYDLITTGHPATYTTLSAKKQQSLTAHADKIEFIPKLHQTILTGHAQVIEKNEQISAPKIIYDTASGNLYSYNDSRSKAMTTVTIESWH